MSRTAAIGRTEIPYYPGIFQAVKAFSIDYTFIQPLIKIKYIDNITFLKKIINMPVFLFVAPEMSLYPFFEILLRSTCINIIPGLEAYHPQRADSDPAIKR